MKILLDKSEAANTLSISQSTLMRLVDAGKINKRNIGTRVLFAVSDLEEFAEKLAAGEIKKSRPGPKRLAV